MVGQPLTHPREAAAASGLNLLVSEPEVLSGVLIGYSCVLQAERSSLASQQRQLAVAGCQRTFTDALCGRSGDRLQWAACLGHLRAGDTLVVTSLDRLASSLRDLISIVVDLRQRGVGFRSLHEGLDTTTPGGRLVFHIFASLAEFVRELLVEGTKDGIDAARARGVRLGRPPALDAEQIRYARQLLTSPENSITSIARLLNVSRSTVYNHLPELAGGRPQDGDSSAAELAPVQPERVRVLGDLFHGHLPQRAGVATVYVGRAAPGLPASRFANPHRVGACRLCGVTHDQADAIAAYIRHLVARPDLVEAARSELGGADLACWCRPGPCHGDVLLAVAAGTDPEALQPRRGSARRSPS